MTPADAKDWWLAAAALTSTLTAVPSAQADTATPTEKAGVVSGLKPDVRTAKGDRVLYVGSDMYRGEKLVTGPEGSLHILFMDQSSITLGPNSELTIDEFVYDPNAKKGKIGVSLAAGLARVVGGHISKTNETTVKTASGTIGIRGGISLVSVTPNSTQSTFLFGQQMTATTNNGTTTTITRPGFSTSLSGQNPPSEPTRATSTLTQSLTNLDEYVASSQPRQPTPTPPGDLISTGNGGTSPGGLSNNRLVGTTQNLGIATTSGSSEDSVRNLLVTQNNNNS
ncbi:FecR family protein [Elstera cyanobacteriorum]|uniref:FecR family protein n=1 Tax=Elstera cyanobacteriorum TaxID=2022747 RepID=UPI002356FDD9|nr:FecR family protein [Elstera cyanobacteriorum]MCK6441637.1 FecR family protein [Elstera cyanobacteriorum]